MLWVTYPVGVGADVIHRTSQVVWFLFFLLNCDFLLLAQALKFISTLFFLFAETGV
jgi:hypothetical protein